MQIKGTITNFYMAGGIKFLAPARISSVFSLGLRAEILFGRFDYPLTTRRHFFVGIFSFTP